MPGPPLAQSAASLQASGSPIAGQTLSRCSEDSLTVPSHPRIDHLHARQLFNEWPQCPDQDSLLPKHQPTSTRGHRLWHLQHHACHPSSWGTRHTRSTPATGGFKSHHQHPPMPPLVDPVPYRWREPLALLNPGLAFAYYTLGTGLRGGNTPALAPC